MVNCLTLWQYSNVKSIPSHRLLLCCEAQITFPQLIAQLICCNPGKRNHIGNSTDGSRKEFGVTGEEYGLLAEGDRGMLQSQGTWYKGFNRL